MRHLVEAGAASQSQLDPIEVAVAQARAATKTAGAAVDEVDVNVSYATVAAPFSGVVVQKMAEVGNIVAPGQPLLVIEDDSRLRIVASVGAEEAANLTPKQLVHVRFGEETRHGIVEGVMSSGDPRAPGLRVQILIENPDRRLRPGTLAVVEIPCPNSNAPVITVSKEAIIERGQLTGAFVVGDDAVARMRWLIVGETKGNLVPVLSGLREGDRVILSPAPDVTDGRHVREVSR
jgi:RND family efflux transporter MFP subunit